MDYWAAELDDYIRNSVDDALSIRQVADYLGISANRLCQHVLYMYRYPLEERIAFLKKRAGEPEPCQYTPLECWLYGKRRPEQHTPMDSWLSSMPYDKVEVKAAVAAGFRIPYSELEHYNNPDMDMPGSRKEDWATFTDYVSGGAPVGAWLVDEDTGETSYFYGKTRSDIDDRHPYKAALHIPGGLYAVFPVELWNKGHRVGHATRAYGGAMVREAVCRDLQKANPYLEYDESRFCFEAYNGKKELSLFIPIGYPLGYAPERMFWYHLEL